MIKVLFHIDSLAGGGAEKVLCTLVNHLNKEEFDVTVQTLYPEKALEFLNSNVHYKFIYPRKNRFYSLVYRLEAELGIIYPLHMKDDYDVECAYLECGPTKVLAYSTNKKARRIAWVHCDFAVAYSRAFAEKTRKWYAKYDDIACVSETAKNSFDDYFNHQFHSRVVYNVVDSQEILRKAQMLPEQPLQKKRFTMVCVARLTAQKNLMRLLKTEKRLLDDGIKADLWIIGEGEERPELETYISEQKMQDSVVLWGYQKNPYPFMKIGDLMVCSSDYEGFSTFITESLILGKPIVTTRCSGMDELLGNSEYGIITENDDDKFYTGLRNILLEQEKMIPKLSEAAAARGKMFTTENLVGLNEQYLKGESL